MRSLLWAGIALLIIVALSILKNCGKRHLFLKSAEKIRNMIKLLKYSGLDFHKTFIFDGSWI